ATVMVAIAVLVRQERSAEVGKPACRTRGRGQYIPAGGARAAAAVLSQRERTSIGGPSPWPPFGRPRTASTAVPRRQALRQRRGEQIVAEGGKDRIVRAERGGEAGAPHRNSGRD